MKSEELSGSVLHPSLSSAARIFPWVDFTSAISIKYAYCQPKSNNNKYENRDAGLNFINFIPNGILMVVATAVHLPLQLLTPKHRYEPSEVQKKGVALMVKLLIR